MADFSPLQKIFATSGDSDGRPQAGARFGLSWPFLAALSLVLVCAVAWAFFMGYMVGKGQHPAESLGVISGAGDAAEPEDTTLPIEMGQAGEKNPALQEEVGSQPAALSPPSGAAAGAWQPAQAKPQARPAPARQAQPARPSGAPASRGVPETRYNYTFQVAAIRNAEEAEKVRKRLVGMKMRASTQKSGKVYLVLVNLRGTATDVGNLKDKLKSANLGKPLQISRKPLETQKPARSR